ncbi:ATP-dependent Clp protease ATP-binding subunit clpt4, chloroplastic [Pleodorina starrii]|uniref:ATP-dependent Clp protease ATP-binding subunit clpt4, chloroplastic n=1 Tax=Pleodorina starrii TaxID=330485 RepID=A0A9W6BXT6_9CHLO|nr:ATP-dependent Clp protease ATP-binding subunit clpt4 [Pleodorina starrii]GLC60203.1 ATP-dependent Clp protease ATP-binding subunit clpt4, chloroplastic [Pleodorina starrii]GLC65964.1 ATP-dependent Clp protease ATP-binding subunit clpt4 [Pleodorina starrii]
MQALAPRLAGARPSARGVASVCRCPTVATTRTCSPSAPSGQDLCHAERTVLGARRSQDRRCDRMANRAAAAAVVADVDDDVGVSDAADAIIRYAINFARASETYEVHSWMVLMGILKFESSTAAQILKKLGLEDLYGAWHEVLWALHVCDGLQPRGFSTEISFADRAFKVVTAASDFAAWHGKDKMYSEDILMALAAGGVLEGLFPDLNLSFERVRKAVEKQAGRRYLLPDEKPEEAGERGPLKSEDDVSFL